MDLKKVLKELKLNENKISMVLGTLVVIVISVLLFRNLQKSPSTSTETSTSSTSTSVEETKVPEVISPSTNMYTVKKGDTLWKIAEDTYGSGYNWVDISKANKLASNNKLLVGQELNLPQATVKKPAVVELPNTGVKDTTDTIAGASYTVVKGDSLWEISVRAYGDGYKWVQVAEANKLTNPDIIYVGSVLSLPR